MKIYTISDIHLDYAENITWMYNLSKSDFTSDILILAGDISHKLELIEKCFKHLYTCFGKVLFVPGNHDLWIDNNLEKNSFAKFFMIKEMAEDHGISINTYNDEGVSIVPLFSWYDFSFGALNDKLRHSWGDFRLCKWPNNMKEQDINNFFIDLNTDKLDVQNKKVISFSHFMPRIDIISHFIPQRLQFLFPVMGSLELEKQLRILNPDIHIYGHSHISNNIDVDGIKYICNPLGYPSENYAAKKLKLIYEE